LKNYTASKRKKTYYEMNAQFLIFGLTSVTAALRSANTGNAKKIQVTDGGSDSWVFDEEYSGKDQVDAPMTKIKALISKTTSAYPKFYEDILNVPQVNDVITVCDPDYLNESSMAVGMCADQFRDLIKYQYETKATCGDDKIGRFLKYTLNDNNVGLGEGVTLHAYFEKSIGRNISLETKTNRWNRFKKSIQSVYYTTTNDSRATKNWGRDANTQDRAMCTSPTVSSPKHSAGWGHPMTRVECENQEWEQERIGRQIKTRKSWSKGDGQPLTGDSSPRPTSYKKSVKSSGRDWGRDANQAV